MGLIRKEPSVRWHWGDNDGFKSLALWDQQTGDGLVVTTNSDNGLSLCYDLAAELTDADFLAAMAAFIERNSGIDAFLFGRSLLYFFL